MLFYQSLILFADGLGLWIALGAGLAAAALGGVAYAILKLGRTLPLKQMLFSGASVLLLLSVAFTGNAVRSLQEADVVAATPIEGEWARLPVLLAELTGIHPTREGIATQLVLLAVLVAGTIGAFLIAPARRRRAEQASATRVGGESAKSEEPEPVTA